MLWHGYLRIKTLFAVEMNQQRAIGIAFAQLVSIGVNRPEYKYTVRRSLDNTEFIIEGRWDIAAIKMLTPRGIINGIENSLGLPQDTLWNISSTTFMGLGLIAGGAEIATTGYTEFLSGIDSAAASKAAYELSKQATIAYIVANQAKWDELG